MSFQRVFNSINKPQVNKVNISTPKLPAFMMPKTTQVPVIPTQQPPSAEPTMEAPRTNDLLPPLIPIKPVNAAPQNNQLNQASRLQTMTQGPQGLNTRVPFARTMSMINPIVKRR